MTKVLVVPLATLMFFAAATAGRAQNAGTPASGPRDAATPATPRAPAPLMTPPPPVPPSSPDTGQLPPVAPMAVTKPGEDAGPASPAGPVPPPHPPGNSPNDAASAARQATLDAVNNAKLGDNGEKDGISPAILRAQVMLDRLHASPGVIDGRNGANFEHALETYEKAEGMKVSANLDQQVWSALVAASGAPVLMDYGLTETDVEGPFYPDLPADYAKLAALPTIGYRSASQKIGAKFHMGEALLAALNPGTGLTAGTRIIVAVVTPAPLHEMVSSIIVDKTKSQVLGFDHKGKVIVAYPATIGSQELPSPSGTYRIKGIAFNPAYYYDPKNFIQGNNKGKLKLPPGPNNPVGLVFMALTKPTYGLHGTPDPSKIDKTASHGCVRMTNWDALQLAHLVKRGVVVRFKG